MKNQAIIFLCILALLSLTTMFAQTLPSTSTKKVEKHCFRTNTSHYQKLKLDIEREFFIVALQSCPSSFSITRILEYIIVNDNPMMQRLAWKSLQTHIDIKTIHFLLTLEQKQKLSLFEKQLFYRYLAQLATPSFKNDLEAVFIQGSYRNDPIILKYSLVGLAKIHSKQSIPIFQRILEIKDFDIETTLSVLEAMKFLKSHHSLTFIKPRLHHKNPKIQKKAIELLLIMNTSPAHKALYVLQKKGPHPQNQALLHNGLQKQKISEKKLGYVISTVKVYHRPSRHSQIVATLSKDTILYIQQKGKQHFPNNSLLPNTGPYIQIITSEGIQGWIFQSKLQLLHN